MGRELVIRRTKEGRDDHASDQGGGLVITPNPYSPFRWLLLVVYVVALVTPYLAFMRTAGPPSPFRTLIMFTYSLPLFLSSIGLRVFAKFLDVHSSTFLYYALSYGLFYISTAALLSPLPISVFAPKLVEDRSARILFRYYLFCVGVGIVGGVIWLRANSNLYTNYPQP